MFEIKISRMEIVAEVVRQLDGTCFVAEHDESGIPFSQEEAEKRGLEYFQNADRKYPKPGADYDNYIVVSASKIPDHWIGQVSHLDVDLDDRILSRLSTPGLRLLT